jgi:gamma-glutamyltranspeptidase/glutathione hydrolase
MKSTIFAVLIFWVYGSAYGQYENTIVGHNKAVNPYQYSVVKSGTFNRASVSSAHPLASMVGAEIMKQGGNAFDATIATQFALAVVYPGAGNIGGGGFTLARKKDGTLIGIDYREAAPAKAGRDMYLDAAGNAQDADVLFHPCPLILHFTVNFVGLRPFSSSSSCNLATRSGANTANT